MSRASLRAASFALVAILAVRIHAQGSAQDVVLTNGSIIQMVADKVDPSLIDTRIRSTPNSFDVTPESLVRLYQRPVAADVISAMLSAALPKDTLMNEGVIYMVANALPRSLIVERIHLANSAFDLTAAGLSALHQGKVSLALVAEMMRASGARSKPGVTVAAVEVTPAAMSALVVSPVTVSPATLSPITTPPFQVIAVTGAVASSAARTTVASVAVSPATADPVIVITPVAAGRVSVAAPNQVADGEAAVFQVRLTSAAVMTKVKEYFQGRNIEFTVDAKATSLRSGWFNERGCGASLRCANRATVRVTVEDAQAVIAVQAFERRRETDTRLRPWTENPKSLGSETAEVAAALERVLAR